MSNSNKNDTLSGERRKRFLENLIKEAIINVLAEQQQQPPPADVATQEPVPDMAPPADAPQEPQDGNAAKAPAEFTVDDMIERLNTVRGGRSFTDPEVYGQLISWFKKLNDDQKAVLQNFLIEIGQIVVNLPQKNPDEQPADQTIAPAPPPPPPAAPQAAPTPQTPPVPAVQNPGM